MEAFASGIGSNTANLIQWISTFLVAFVVGFIIQWQLALVLLGITPVLAVAGAVFTKVGSHTTNTNPGTCALLACSRVLGWLVERARLLQCNLRRVHLSQIDFGVHLKFKTLGRLVT